jgi:hypothetical protein
MANVSQLGAYGDVDGLSLMFRNKLINGDMRVDQRNSGSSQTFTAAAALAYSVDRWYGYCTGANVTGQRVAGSGGTQYTYRFTGAASVTAIGFGQRIEATNSYELSGQNATLSVDISNSLLTTVTWTAYYANTTDTFGTLASPTRTQIATGTFTVSSTLTRYSASMLVPTAATTGIEIVFTVGAQTSGTWVISNVQFEGADQPTPFEKRLFNSEFDLCRRYYQQFNSLLATMSGLGSTTTRVTEVRFSPNLRATPANADIVINTLNEYSSISNKNRLSSNSATSIIMEGTVGVNSNYGEMKNVTISAEL